MHDCRSWAKMGIVYIYTVPSVGFVNVIDVHLQGDLGVEGAISLCL